MWSTISILALAALAQVTTTYAGGVYNLQDNVVGNGFYDFFGVESIPDPTHGRVNYVDSGTARAKNLTYANGDTFILRADHTTTLTPSGPGRDSVRLLSHKTFTRHVAVFNVRHMPQACGTWPAIWEVGPDWPNAGEIDIVEGVNDSPPNVAVLHTATGCTMPSSGRVQSGIAQSLDCQWYNGCGVQTDSQISYGPAFNNNGGGWFAIERTNDYIRVWFWPRNVGNPPGDVRNPSGSVNTNNWGTPFADFPNTQCDIGRFFGAHQIVINLTLCGDWAGNTFNANGCPGDCSTFVNNNPGAFSNAYFDFAYIRTYV